MPQRPNGIKYDERYKMTTRNMQSLALVLSLSVSLAGCWGGKSSDEYLASARSYSEKGQNDAAIIELKNLLAADAGNTDARLLFAKLLNEKGDGVSAERELLKIAKSSQVRASYRIELGRALLLQNNADRILREITPEGMPLDIAAEILAIRGGAYLSLRQLDKARGAFDEALKIAPKHVRSILGLASIAVASDDPVGADKWLDQALVAAPQSVDVLLFKGDLLRQQNKLDDAMLFYQRAAKADPAQYAPLLRQAILLVAQGKLPSAKETLAKVDKIRPGLSDTHYYTALIHFREGLLEQAQSLVQEVLKQAPNNAPATLLAGAIADRKGHYSLAESYLEPVVRAFPLHTPARKLLAGVQLKAGHTDRALAILQTGLKIAPDDPSLLLLAGDATYQAQQFAQANEYYARASKLSPDNLKLRTRHGMSQLALGQTERAMAELEVIANEDKLGGQADYLLVHSYLNRKDYGRAMDACAALQKKQPKNPQVYHLKAEILLAQNNRHAAIQALEEAYILRPSYLPTVMRLVALDLQSKQPDVAQKRFERLLEIDSKNVDAMTAFAVFLLEQPGKRQQAMDLLERAHKLQPGALSPAAVLVEQLLLGGDKNKALTYAQQIVAARPDSVDALYLLARTQLANRQNNQALASYRKLVSLAPDLPMTHFRLAGVQASLNDNDGAQASLKTALKLQPDFTDALVLLVGLQANGGNVPAALETAKAAQQQPASAYQGYLLEGDLLTQKKQLSDALASYRRALELNDNAVPVMKIYAVQRLTGNQQAADTLVVQWLKSHPADIKLRTYLARINLQQGKLTQAAEYYQAILKVMPNHADALNDLAWIYQQLKDPRALDTAEAALRAAPTSPVVMDTLAVILQQQGDKRRSLELLQKAAAARPSDVEISAHLALAFHANGRRSEALAIISRLEKSGSPFLKRAEFKEIARQVK
jgi:putative PEP-CTERM system TPR-repeat lipoprotein